MNFKLIWPHGLVFIFYLSCAHFVIFQYLQTKSLNGAIISVLVSFECFFVYYNYFFLFYNIIQSSFARSKLKLKYFTFKTCVKENVFLYWREHCDVTIIISQVTFNKLSYCFSVSLAPVKPAPYSLRKWQRNSQRQTYSVCSFCRIARVLSSNPVYNNSVNGNCRYSLSATTHSAN